jgi:hypothetical protein
VRRRSSCIGPCARGRGRTGLFPLGMATRRVPAGRSGCASSAAGDEHWGGRRLIRQLSRRRERTGQHLTLIEGVECGQKAAGSGQGPDFGSRPRALDQLIGCQTVLSIPANKQTDLMYSPRSATEYRLNGRLND